MIVSQVHFFLFGGEGDTTQDLLLIFVIMNRLASTKAAVNLLNNDLLKIQYYHLQRNNYIEIRRDVSFDVQYI